MSQWKDFTEAEKRKIARAMTHEPFAHLSENRAYREVRLMQISVTKKKIDHFKEVRKSWRKRGVITEGEYFLGLRRAQAVRGQTRKNIMIVDLGDRRAIISTSG